jgi:telomerase reverse transcriptase
LPFKDYTLRESEIKRLILDKNGEIDPKKQARVPKRLLGQPLELIRKLRKLHSRCAYAQLLKYYCALSDETASFLENREIPSAITDLATPASRVSAFSQAVIKKVVPNAFWGEDEGGEHNKRLVLKHIHVFLHARKFESFTLQTLLEGLKITSMSWLCLPQQVEQNMSQSDFAKRKELLAELIYYLFDSLLIPLVRSNFHVTESNVHRNRLFYFRHDVWQQLCEPALEDFKANLFEELNSKTTKIRLASRSFGYSNVRLLPKATGFRPITNLRRRPYIRVNGKKMLGKSINSALNPAFRALNYEKVSHETMLRRCYH